MYPYKEFYEYSGNMATDISERDIVFYTVPDYLGYDKLGIHSTDDFQNLLTSDGIIITMQKFIYDMLFTYRDGRPYWNAINNIWFWCCGSGNNKSPLAQRLADMTGAEVIAPVDKLLVTLPDEYFVTSLSAQRLAEIYNLQGEPLENISSDDKQDMEVLTPEYQ